MNIMLLVYGMVMLASLAGLLFLKKNASKYPQGGGLALLLFVVVLGCGFGLLHSSGVLKELGLDFGFETKKLTADAAIYAAQADMLMPVIVKANLDKGKILLIHSPGFDETEDFKAFVERLVSFGVDKTKIIEDTPTDSPKGKGKTPKTPMLPVRLTAQLLDKAANRHGDCKLVISMVGLPAMNSRDASCIARKYSASAQQWIIMEPSSDRASLEHGLKSGNVLAACVFCQNPVGEIASVPEAPEKAFALRYELLQK